MNGHLGDLVSALLDGELAGATADDARAHLAACPMCSDVMARVGEARSWVRSLPPVEPPASYFERVAAAHHERELLGRRRRIGVAVLAGSAAAGLAVLGVVAPQEPATAPRVPRLVEAHATAVGTGDLLSQLVSAGVPVSLPR